MSRVQRLGTEGIAWFVFGHANPEAARWLVLESEAETIEFKDDEESFAALARVLITARVKYRQDWAWIPYVGTELRLDDYDRGDGKHHLVSVDFEGLDAFGGVEPQMFDGVLVEYN